MMRNKWSRR